MSRRGPIVAIDGPAGSGKSTVARRLAEVLEVPHLDTGAYYRAVTLEVLRRGAAPSDADAATEAADEVHIERVDDRTYLDGEDVEDEIRGPDVTAAVSVVSAHPGVRDAVMPLQRDAARIEGGVIEGRDIGTVVLPDADLKVFLTASPQERARRRGAQVGTADLEAVEAELVERDRLDSSRQVAPLEAAPDAWQLDTTDLGIDEVVEAIAERARAARRLAPVRVHDRLPRVVVVGRPNVGKSTLVNRILGARVTIVERKPGVTRDRTEHLARWAGRPFLVVDTGGWEHAAEGLSAEVVRQAERAIDSGDLILFVVDASVGALEDDERYARLLRRADRPVLLVANKVDSPKQELAIHELYGLGIGEPVPVSAQHGRGVGDLLDQVVATLPQGPAEVTDDDPPRVAIVGRPNVGKSSLFNRLLGEERSIVDAVPHTTRDAVDTTIEVDGEPWVFVDTAGLRRRYRTGEDTELYSVDRTRRAVEDADLALFVVDASEPIGEQDQRLAAMVREAGCGIVQVFNKWDLVDEDRRFALKREVDRMLHFAAWAPRVNISALSGRSVQRVVPQLRTVFDAYRRRVPTAELNRWLDEVTQRQTPPRVGQRPLRIRYVTQTTARPPRFLLFANRPVPAPYRRYLENQLRERYGFPGVPLVLEERSRRSHERRSHPRP
ncbi:MAG: ribosome biogenesis GTPase Der [Actinobacteria bacterium]|nr:ribosome biogenesis GTPase Der [Actinomycetota bacterium]